MAARLKAHYDKEVAPALKKEFNYSSSMAIPRLAKIVVNMGMGEATQNAKILDGAALQTRTDYRTEAGDHQGQEVNCVPSSCGPGSRSASA